MGNTLKFTGLALLLGYAVPFAIAIVINEFRHLKGFFRIAVYLPVMLLLQVVATMQVFIEPYQLTGFSNPDTITVMVLIYRYAFTVNQDFGLAAAMSVQLFVVLAAFSALYLRLTTAVWPRPRAA